MESRARRQKRHIRLRKRIAGDSQKPRIAVFRSSKYIQVQLIDDTTHKTLLGLSTKKFDEKGLTKTDEAKKLAVEFAKGVEKLGKFEGFVFDRGGFRYHGRIKALAESLRENGLKF